MEEKKWNPHIKCLFKSEKSSGKYTYNDYILNGCHPTGFNEAIESLIFGQSSIDTLLERIECLNEGLRKKDEAIQYMKMESVIAELEKLKLNLVKQIHFMEDKEHCYPLKAIYWQDFCMIINKRINDIKVSYDFNKRI